MTETNLSIATKGTREQVIKVTSSVTVTAGAAALNTLAVTFADPFVNAPEVIGVVCTDSAAVKANVYAHDITTTGMTVGTYQVLEADLASGSYDIEVTLVGWKAA